ncbi:hypothetical protein V8B97DRAFT_1875329 [Scleroderma yunnanense]
MSFKAFIDRTELVSPTRITATPEPRLPPDARNSASALRKFGETIYRQVWDEFYKWEPGYVAGILTDIENKPVVRVRGGARKMAKGMVRRLAERTPPSAIALDSCSPVVVITEHPAGGGARTTTVRPIPTVVLDHPHHLPPHPPYESCPPTNRSILVPENEKSTAKFLPYADDPSFPFKSYLKKFSHLEWQDEFDPDLDMIQLETIWKLHVIHDLSMSDINRMHILKPTRTSHNTGLLWDCMQRDLLQWPGASQINVKDSFLKSETPLSDDLHRRLTSMLRVFCPSLNCLGPLCLTHVHPYSTLIPLNKPRLAGASMILSEGHPCGPDCFRLVPDIESYAETLPPSSRDPSQTPFADILHTILGISPDLFPCQLAVICFKPCKELFVERMHLFPDNTISPLNREPSTGASTDGDSEGGAQRKGAQHKKKKKRRAGEAFTSDSGSFFCFIVHSSRLEPCAHPGECRTSKCQCYARQLHCQPACRCGISCIRQWPACTCQQCDNNCSCRKNQRECVPGLCVKCSAEVVGSHQKLCANTRMQRLYIEPMEVKIGSHGLGAFATHDIAPNVCIGTYAGHIMSNSTAELTGQASLDITRHNLRNYLFEFVHGAEIFDAARVGNGTRFLNHRSGGADNIGAKNMLVNGEHQIGFFALKRVKAGEELFLDYGENYWNEYNNDDDETEGEEGTQDP